jgi:hypothetical protein
MLGAGKYQRPPDRPVFEDVDKKRGLVALVDKQNFLINLHRDGCDWGCRDGARILQHIGRKLGNSGGKRCGKQ